eukprot:TRINITY_DN5809_c0_g1_i1.p1 TRINITY_DN5809_c0_g1~~TRINITY_DN5809_c0_g1_i1.p1  ORF type:complete len:402 (+),score=85.57 TRINITY_DN5809_c0_g1_i1:215-1420(+)
MAANVKEGWERSDFPILCESCLGSNPYVRMMKMEFAKECKVCTRPFTVFRWRPGGPDARYKKTEICQTCAKVKNVCQTCLLDLQYNLPVQVRDSSSEDGTVVAGSVVGQVIPVSDVHREYFAQQADKLAEENLLTYDKNQPANDVVQRLARKAPYYQRNKAHICSFFVRGECKRGTSCPYRHEIPEDKGELAHQNIKDRYYGVNDPVAKKMLERAEGWRKLTPPEDPDIMTLFVGGVDPTKVTEEDLKDALYAFGEIKSIKIVVAKQCGFVEFTTRQAAELCAEKMANKLVVKGDKLKLAWAKPQTVIGGEGGDGKGGKWNKKTDGESDSVNSRPAPPPPGFGGQNAPQMYYPSMNPNAFGTNPNAQQNSSMPPQPYFKHPPNFAPYPQHPTKQKQNNKNN